MNHRERDLFLEALELASSDERQRWVERACHDDSQLRQRVLELLEAYERADRFLVPPPEASETRGDK